MKKLQRGKMSIWLVHHCVIDDSGEKNDYGDNSLGSKSFSLGSVFFRVRS
jgi:hypothetical protein